MLLTPCVYKSAEPVTVAQWTSLSGTTVAMDGSLSTVYNAKADWDVQGTMPAELVERPVISLQYWFANDATNYGKKVRFLDVYYWTGTAWVLHTTLTSSTPTSGGPTAQEHVFSSPMPNPTGRIRVVGRGTWDQFSYRWVTEVTVTVK